MSTGTFNNKNQVTSKTDKNGNRTTFEYDSLGNITKMVDPLKYETSFIYDEYDLIGIHRNHQQLASFEYDERGNLLASSDAIGRISKMEYNAKAQPCKLIAPDGSEINLAYDTRGNITAITDALGNATRYEYNALNQVTRITQPEGNLICFSYNAAGDIERVTNAAGDVRRYSYNQGGKVTEITDWDGSTVKYAYNNVGKVETITDQLGGVTSYTYDKVWNVTKVTNALGAETHYAYDKLNRVVKVTDTDGNCASYRYDPNGNVISATSPQGAEVSIIYDALNRPKKLKESDNATTSIAYDSMGNVTQVTDAMDNVTQYEYDLANQLVKVTDPLGNQTGIAYTALGMKEQITNPKGDTCTYTYYPGGALKSVCLPCGETEIYEYDKNGNVKTVTDALGNVTAIEYDSLNQVVKTINALGHSKHFKYDVMGNITHVTDENGNITQYKYSIMGDVIEIIDPSGNSTEYSYDAIQRLTEVRQYSNPGKLGEPQCIINEYQKTGEAIPMVNPLGDIVRHTYDKAGNLTAKLDEDGLETLYSYNTANQLTKIAYADGKTVELSYNPLRQLTEMRDWLGTTTITLDALGRATKVTDHNGEEVGYTYNVVGQREKLTYPDGAEVRYEYTASGNLSKVIAGADITSYSYDLAGRVSERILPDNTATRYEFNPIGALTSLTHSNGNDILDQFRYTYDPAGNITQIDKHRTGIGADNGVFKFAYDPLGRLTEAINGAGNAKQYMYDTFGNRVKSVQGGIDTHHEYNARNQLIKTTEGSNITDYTYDKRGNLIQVTKNGQLQAAYTFDATNMMISAHSPTKGDATYTYNGFLNRVAKLENKQHTNYILDMTRPYDNLLMTKGVQGQETHAQSFVWGNGLLSAKSSKAAGASQQGSFHYLQDHLGSPIRLLGNDSNHNGTPHGTAMSYDEFGVLEVGVTGKQNFANPFGFTGYQHDNISGMYYAQARYYAPQIGRFAAQDPIKHKLNWYNYCNANPVNLVDPSGLYYIRQHIHYPDAQPGLGYRPLPVQPNHFNSTPAHPDLFRRYPEYFGTVETTTVLHFSNIFTAGASNTVGFVVPGGCGLNFLTEDWLGVTGGASSTSERSALESVAWGAATKGIPILGGVLGRRVPRMAGPVNVITTSGGHVYKGYSAYKSVGSTMGAMERARQDQIIRVFFEANNIPTSHTIRTYNGLPDTSAAELFSRQMQMSYAFLLEHYSYFSENFNNGNRTLHQLDQQLASRSGWRQQRLIDQEVNRYRHALSTGLFDVNGTVRGGLSTIEINMLVNAFRQDLRQYQSRIDSFNELFLEEINQIGGLVPNCTN